VEKAGAAAEHWSAMVGTLPLVGHGPQGREAAGGQVPRVLAGRLARTKIVPPSSSLKLQAGPNGFRPPGNEKTGMSGGNRLVETGGRPRDHGAAVQPPRERAFKGRGAPIDTAVEEGQGAGSEVDALPG